MRYWYFTTDGLTADGVTARMQPEAKSGVLGKELHEL